MSKYYEEREAAILRVQETRDMVDALRRNILMLTQTILQVRETSPLYSFMLLRIIMWCIVAGTAVHTGLSREAIAGR